MGRIMGSPMAGGRADKRFPLNSSNNFYLIHTKVSDNVCYQKTEVKFDKQQNPVRLNRVIALELVWKLVSAQ